MDDARTPLETSGCDGVRWGLIAQATLVLVACSVAAICMYECSAIAERAVFFDETLGGKPLPLVTQWVIEYRIGFLMAAFFIPGAALASFLQRDRGLAIGVLILLIMCGSLHALFVHWSLKLPLVVTLKTMGR
jgi:hypothetical protein